MEKRLIIAIVLSSFVLLLWSFITPKPATGPVTAPAVVSAPALNAPAVVLPGSNISDEKTAAAPNLIKFSSEKLELVFDEDKAAIKDVIFKDYQSYKLSLFDGLMSGANFKKR